MSLTISPDYGITCHDLRELFKEKGSELLQQKGGVSGIAALLKVELQKGVHPASLDARRLKYGKNEIPENPLTPYWQYVWAALADFTIRLLCVCAVIEIIIAVIWKRDEALSWLEGVAIIITVLFVVNLQAYQDWSKERSFRKLNADVNRLTLPVLRDGNVVQVPRQELVVGDIIEVGVGDILEADGVLIHGEDIQVDESALTGEPEDIKKDTENDPFLLSGTAVKSGVGRYLALAVGVHSVSGRITALIRGQKVEEQTPKAATEQSLKETDEELGERTPQENATKKEETAGKGSEDEEGSGSVLGAKLEAMVVRIGYFAFGSAGLATLVMLIRYVIERHIVVKNDWDNAYDLKQIVDAFVTGIAIVVVAVPEGLPLAVTLALSLSMQRMQKDNNLVKHLDATETMGSATTICSDKTGTLTQNRMTVVRAFIGGKEFESPHGGSQTCGKIIRESKLLPEESRTSLCENICLTIAQGTDIAWNAELNSWSQTGNKTDCALLGLAHDLGFEYVSLRKQGRFQSKDKTGNTVLGIKQYPFSSSRKRGGIVVPLTSDPDGPCRLYAKGASEILLKMCNQEELFTPSGPKLVPLGDERREQIFSDVIDVFASAAMRTISLAYCDFPAPIDWDEEVSVEESVRLTGLNVKTYKAETNLIFLGVMGIHDPLREGVPEAVAACNTAGVDVRMVTGDHKATAVAIAKSCNILRKSIDYKDSPGGPLTHQYTALTGEELRSKVLVGGSFNQAVFDEIWPHLRVLARSTPEDKHMLVTGIMASEVFKTPRAKELGIFGDRQVVAVTGDGTNDAPALRVADVGFAMKLAGTRVAQDAADILLLDDNFASVVKACAWGRNVYESIVKFLQFQLTVNVSAVGISVVGAVSVSKSPLAVVQMLWVNLIMDSFGALALAAEPPTPVLLERKPYGKDKALLSYEIICSIAGQSIYQLVVLLVILFAGAGPPCPAKLTDAEKLQWDWVPGGLLNIESSINRGHGALTLHSSVIFNTFVWMQLFNWINSRKLRFELNPFEGLQNNKSFIGIWVACAFVQVILVQAAGFGGGPGENQAFQTKALTGYLWAVSLICGVISLPLQIIIGTVCKALKPLLVDESKGDYPHIHEACGVIPNGAEGLLETGGSEEPAKRSWTMKSAAITVIAGRRLQVLTENKAVTDFTSEGVKSAELRSQPSSGTLSLTSQRSSLSLLSANKRWQHDRRTIKEFSSKNAVSKRLKEIRSDAPKLVKLSRRRSDAPSKDGVPAENLQLSLHGLSVLL